MNIPNLLFVVIRELDKRSLYFSLSRHRPDSVMLTVTLVGKRIEIDVFDDEHVEYSVFTGSEDVSSNLENLFALLGPVD